MRKYLVAAAGIAMIASANGAFAASATSNFNVRVTVSAACTVSAGDMVFGPYSGSIPAGATATTTANVSCNNGTSYALSFNASTSQGTATATMVNPAPGATSIPANLTVATTSKTATGGVDGTPINGVITAGVNNPVVGTYTVAQAIYVLY
ncbi:spore coat protein U domain-containing protein [Aestuariivirga sp.]|uniref:spore coat protein U domain-containing protein n=1 Tax=Aestuariivirga sp. TaxID=2650926 RepID=UPI0039E4C040